MICAHGETNDTLPNGPHIITDPYRCSIERRDAGGPTEGLEEEGPSP
jgi:hypothetical protein